MLIVLASFIDCHRKEKRKENPTQNYTPVYGWFLEVGEGISPIIDELKSDKNHSMGRVDGEGEKRKQPLSTNQCPGSRDSLIFDTRSPFSRLREAHLEVDG